MRQTVDKQNVNKTYVDPVQCIRNAGPECKPGLYWSARSWTCRNEHMKSGRAIPEIWMFSDRVSFMRFVTTFEPRPVVAGPWVE